jgi:hypothetical protein
MADKVFEEVAPFSKNDAKLSAGCVFTIKNVPPCRRLFPEQGKKRLHRMFKNVQVVQLSDSTFAGNQAVFNETVMLFRPSCLR